MEQNKMFNSDWNDVVFQGRNELVFATKNKAYGAYIIRKNYNQTMVSAFFISIIFCAFVFSLPTIISWFNVEQLNTIKVVPYDPEIITPVEIEIPQVKIEKPIVPYQAPIERTTKFEIYKVTDDVTKDEIVPQAEIEKSGSETKIGDSSVPELPVSKDNGSLFGDPNTNELAVTVEEWPKFLGGEKAFSAFLQKNIVYPPREFENQISGIVYIEFTVNKQGVVSDVALKHGVTGGPGLAAEALRVVKLMPAWEPAKVNGKAVNFRFVVPLRFILKN